MSPDGAVKIENLDAAEVDRFEEEIDRIRESSTTHSSSREGSERGRDTLFFAK